MSIEKTEKSREIATKFLDYLSKGDVKSISNMFEGSNAGWRVLGQKESFPLARKYGPDEIGDLFKAVSPVAEGGEGKIELLGIFADGDRAFVEIHAKATNSSGKPYDNRLLFSIHTGKEGITLIEEYMDTRHLNELLFHTDAK
jgi:ketosteroid isomerase-like protein